MADGTNEKTAGGAASMQKLLSMLEGDDGSVSAYPHVRD